MKIILPMGIEYVLSTLKNNGYEGYIVGGCVRDFLMGQTPHDYDVTTNATPEQVKACFKQNKVIETGLKHGTVTVLVDGENIEITTYRIDGDYKDNRHPDNVFFSTKIEDDVKRRDFTVNSIAYNPEKGFVDLFDGRGDIEAGIITCVGNADERFNEDGLRILRALRFASVLGFDISKETSDSIHRNKSLINNVSAERILEEFKKLICGKKAHMIFEEYVDVIGVFIPEILEMVGFEQNNPYHCYDVFKHTVAAVKNAPDNVIIRLAAFFHDVGKPRTYFADENGIGHFYSHAKVSEKIANDVLIRLKSDNFTREKVCMLVRYHDRQIEENAKSVKRLLAKLSFEDVRLLLTLKRCDTLAQTPEIHNKRCAYLDRIGSLVDEIENEGACLSLRTLNINGNDLIALGIDEGKLIGEILNSALKSVIDEKIPNNKNELLKFVEKFIKN